MQRAKSSGRISLLIFTTLILSFSFVSMTKYCFASAMVFIVDEGYMTNFQTGLISSGFWLAYGVSQLFGGMLTDKLRPEPLVTFGFVAAGVVNGAIYFCYQNYVLTLILWVINALCQFGVWPAIFKIVTAMYSGKQRTVCLVVASMATPLAILLSYAVAALIPRWQMNFIISCVGLIVVAVLWETVRRTSSDHLKGLEYGSGASKKDALASGSSRDFGTVRLILCSGLMIIFVIGIFRGIIAYMPGLLPSVINASYSAINPSVSTMLSLIPLFCGVVAPIFSGWISKYVSNELVMATILFAVMLPVSLVTLWLGKIGYPFIIASMTVLAFGAGSVTLFIVSLISARFIPFGKGATVVGLLNAGAAFGNVAASALMTFLADTLGWLASFVALVSFTAASLALLLIELPIWRRFRKKYLCD